MNLLKALFKWLGIFAGCLVAVFIYIAFSSVQNSTKTSIASQKPQTKQSQSKEENKPSKTYAEYNDQKLAAFKLAEFHTTKAATCDKSYGFKLLEPKYGVITHDLNKNHDLIKLSSPVKAIMTGVEFVCQDNKMGLKNKRWNYLIIANDTEFDRYRCQKSAGATKFAPDGYRTIKYQPDTLQYKFSEETPRSKVERFAQKCGFSVT